MVAGLCWLSFSIFSIEFESWSALAQPAGSPCPNSCLGAPHPVSPLQKETKFFLFLIYQVWSAS